MSKIHSLQVYLSQGLLRKSYGWPFEKNGAVRQQSWGTSWRKNRSIESRKKTFRRTTIPSPTKVRAMLNLECMSTNYYILIWLGQRLHSWYKDIQYKAEHCWVSLRTCSATETSLSCHAVMYIITLYYSSFLILLLSISVNKCYQRYIVLYLKI